MGLNTTGLPDTSLYNLGRGRLYAAILDSTTGLPGDDGWRDLGNAPEFNTSLDTETLKHQSSRIGLKVTDKEVVISQEVSVSFQLDELSAQNLALFLSGTATAGTVNPTVAGFALTVFCTVAPDFSAIGGRWYNILSPAGVQAVDLLPANVTITTDTGGTPVVLVLGTDYDLDAKNGRVFIRAAASVTAGLDIAVTVAATAAAAATFDEVEALTGTNPAMALLFIGVNPADNDKETAYTFHQLSLKSEGDLAGIGDEWTVMGYTATAEANVAGKTLTIKDHANS